MATGQFNVINAVPFVRIQNVATLEGFISIIDKYSTGDFVIFGSVSDFGFYNTAATLDSIVLVFKASSNNAYFLAYSRDHAAIGNISIQNGTISVKHELTYS